MNSMLPLLKAESIQGYNKMAILKTSLEEMKTLNLVLIEFHEREINCPDSENIKPLV